MTIVRFAREDESVSYGLLAGDEIQPIDGSPFGTWSEDGLAGRAERGAPARSGRSGQGAGAGRQLPRSPRQHPRADPAGAVLEDSERLHRPRRHHPAARGPGARRRRGRGGGGDRPVVQPRFRAGSAELRARLHLRQRRQRSSLAARRQPVVARQVRPTPSARSAPPSSPASTPATCRW